MKENAVSAVLAGCLAVILAIFGGWSATMTSLVILIGLDMASGWARAYVQKRLSSRESIVGLLRKTLILIAIAVAAQVDIVLGTNNLARDGVVLFYCASEGLSIVENLVAAGLPVPDALREALKQLSEKKYEQGSNAQ